MQPKTTDELWQRYQQLRSSLDAGKISYPQFVAAVNELQVRDQGGTWWAIDAQSGGYLRYDGTAWVPGAHAEIHPARSAGKTSKTRGMGCSNITRFLGLTVPLLIAGFWMLYTAIPGHSEGVDIMTPLIVGGVPAALWFFRERVDAIVLRYLPSRDRFPRAVRMGVAFALPFVLGALFSSAGGGAGYGSIRMTSLLSILGSHFLTRQPEVRL
jgi:hypothetical protein